MISFVSAIEPAFIFKQDDSINITLQVLDSDNSPTAGTTDCYLTIKDKDLNVLKDYETMFYTSNGFFTLYIGDVISTLGSYPTILNCNDGTDDLASNFYFEVTKTGQSFDFSSSLVSIGIIIGTIAIMFLFMIFGFKLTESEKLYPIGFLFIIFSVIFSVYLLHQSYVFSEVIFGLESFSQTSGVIYVVVLWTLSGLALITMALMLIAFIKELGKISDRKKFGDDFNPVEDSYNI